MHAEGSMRKDAMFHDMIAILPLILPTSCCVRFLLSLLFLLAWLLAILLRSRALPSFRLGAPIPLHEKTALQFEIRGQRGGRLFAGPGHVWLNYDVWVLFRGGGRWSTGDHDILCVQ